MSEQIDHNLPLILDSYEAYGCRVNAIGVDELFRRYEQTGFLYPAKMQRLAPYWSVVKDNWQRAARGGDSIHFIVSADMSDGAWASITSWRSTTDGWNTQHLVGTGGPSASRAAMLSTQAVRMRDHRDGSHQNWFQRSNRFANKVFGSIASTLEGSVGWAGDYSYFSFPLAQINSTLKGINIRACAASDTMAVRELAGRLRSRVYVVAEGLDADDFCLDAVDELYCKVGLRRYRRVLVAEIDGLSELAGVALAYRGPLGLNFSFLENRCDLILNPLLTAEKRTRVMSSLMTAAAEHYTNFPPQMIPVIVEQSDSDRVRALGGQYVRDYAQSVWLRDGYEAWYRHVERIYDKVGRAERRRGLAAKTHVDSGRQA